MRSPIVWKRIFMYLIISLKSEMEVSINSTTPFGGCMRVVILHCKVAQTATYLKMSGTMDFDIYIIVQREKK